MASRGSQEYLQEFLETQSVWLNFNLARLRAIADYQQNVARLEKLVGGKIDDSHIQ